MTPEEISKLTDQELNELIAVKRGWIYNPYEKFGSLYEPSVLWHNPKTNESFYSAAPDFSGLWRWAGELLEEMADNGYCPALIFDDNDHWSVSTDGNQTLNFESPCDVDTSFFVKKESWRDSPTRAIAEAWYLMECEK